MARYALVFLEVARDQYQSLPDRTREQLDIRLEQLAENPRQQPPSAYDQGSDQWTTTYGHGAGLIMYAVVADRQVVIVLRLV